MDYNSKYNGEQIDSLLDLVNQGVGGSGNNQNIVVDTAGTGSYILQPNEVLVIANLTSEQLRIEELRIPTYNEDVDISEQPEVFFATYTVLFRPVITTYFSLTLPDGVLWANGSIPTIEQDVEYELSISYRGFTPESGYFKAVLTPFKPAE